MSTIDKQTASDSRTLARAPALYLGVVLGLALVWVFWPTFTELGMRWGSDVRYSHGYLVPLFTGYLLWSRRALLQTGDLRPSWWGLPVLCVGLGLRFAGMYLFYGWLPAYAVLPCLAGLMLLIGGWRALRWAWPAIAFLVFMVPLPYLLEVALAGPLQTIASRASTYGLQTLGFLAFAEGNVIRLGQVRIGVVEACSGLSMLMLFVALSTAVGLLIRRPWPVKAAIVVSAIPIAIAANSARIIVTAILHKTVGSELADYVFHDLAGWLMMPLALVLLWAELGLIAWVFPPPVADEPVAVSFGWGLPAPAPSQARAQNPAGGPVGSAGAAAAAAAAAAADHPATPSTTA